MVESAEMLPKFIGTTFFTTPIDKKSALQIKKWLRNEKYTKVLEVGSGLGWWAAALSHKGGGKNRLSPDCSNRNRFNEKNWLEVLMV